ncbi:site-specific integrase [Aeromicrobium ginsengisoli]|uniref:Site-specific integrase n=1 Tax=Aeromicrobium ginsengisoli TaxID=363867 RepID=A0A5M4FHY3_9ACTN|nr:site-specific integrase [Aeromicrobium ginsengisoli]KAA1399661.1 site-specific integrase [Aeromicrobium ginsengisoli]
MTDHLELAAEGLSLVDRASIDEAIRAARAPGTRRTYASAWRSWETWCVGRGVNAFPADPMLVAAHLAERHSAGVSTSRLDVTVAAIRARHIDEGLEDPTAVRGVQLVVRGLRRIDAGERAVKQAHPLTVAEVRRMLGTLDRATLAGKRDAAILLIGFAGALRRSEISNLRVSDLSFKADGVVVRLRKSKSDQEGAGAFVGVVRGAHQDTDPVSALRDWLGAAGLATAGPLFVRVRRGGHVDRVSLHPDTVNAIVKRMACCAGLSDLPISAHSLRAGHATVAAEAGVPASRLARTTRHADLRTLAMYVRPGEVLRDTSSGSLGL